MHAAAAGDNPVAVVARQRRDAGDVLRRGLAKEPSVAEGRHRTGARHDPVSEPVSRSRDGYCSLALAGNAAVGLDISKAEDRAAHRLDDIPVVTKRGCDLVRQSCETLALGGYRPHSECPGRARLQVVVGRAPGRGRKDAALARQTWRRCGHGVADDRASSITCRRAPLDAC